MTTTNNNEEDYWQAYISLEFNKNLNLYVEIAMQHDNTYPDLFIFKDGNKLPMIHKQVLLEYIKNYMNFIFVGSKYIVSTVGRRPGKSSYYIVVSIIETGYDYST